MASTQKIILMAIVLNLILGIAYSVSMDDFTDVDNIENLAYSYTTNEDTAQDNNRYLTTSQTQSNEIEANAIDQIKTGRSLFGTLFTGIKQGTTGSVPRS